MALDKDTLQEIKAYMDERSEAWKVQAGDAARDVARDEVLAADGRIAKRNTVFGVGIGVVLLSVAGFSYQAITSGVEASTKQIATEVAQNVASEQLADGTKLLDLQERQITEIINARGQVVAAQDKAEEASQNAENIAKEVAALELGLAERMTEAKDALNKARKQSSDLSDQIETTKTLESELTAALQDANEARERFSDAASRFDAASEQLGEAQNLLDDIVTGENPLADTAEQIVGLALQNQEIRGWIVDAAKFPRGAVVAFSSVGEHSEVCPEGWSYFGDAQNRFLMGASDAYPSGQTGGEAVVTLSVDQIPSHSHAVGPFDWGHTINGNGHPARIDVDDGGPWDGRVGKLTAQATGGGQPHNNIPPFIAIHFCKKD